MRFEPPLVPAVIQRRYKRFLADVELADGRLVTVHCPNSGSMKSCWGPGWSACLSRSNNPRRKYAYTLEMAHNGGCWIGVHTGHPNRLVEEAIRDGILAPFRGVTELRREVKCGEHSRLDLAAVDGDRRCWIEVKNVTLLDAAGRFCFPDAVTMRGLKHLRVLMDQLSQGDRAAMVYVIQRSDGAGFAPAAHIDPDYAAALAEAAAAGVEIYAYQAAVSPERIELSAEPEPLTLNP